MRNVARLVMIAGLCGAPCSVGAQDRVEETVVVTAAATEVPLGATSRSLTVITRDQFERLPILTVADILRLVGSVDVRARAERGGQTDFSIRGANFGQALVLVDGIRLNDPQTGHHNGDIPVPVELVERIEVLRGAGSSLFGADAMGGAINIITRSAVDSSASVETGSYGLVAGRGQFNLKDAPWLPAVAVEAARSSGFMPERELDSIGVTSRFRLGSRSRLLVGYQGKSFGANGFYGPSPSHEWTNQTLVGVNHEIASRSAWKLTSVASYRTHGDRFLWDARQPGVSENIHRTHVLLGTLKASRPTGQDGSVTVGIEGGSDWIRSTNLGDRSTIRVSGFGEWRRQLSPTIDADASVRLDRYSEFGAALSPAFGAVWRPRPDVRIRTTTGRSFRVPTFTERYYSDPAHLARPDLSPETAWSTDLGVELFGAAWIYSATTFYRAERDVIDWLRPTSSDRWRTYNVRNVAASGLELSAQRSLVNRRGVLRIDYTLQSVRSPSVNQLSKYTMDYAPQRLSIAATSPPLFGATVGARFAYTRRHRSAGITDDAVVDMRVSRRLARYEIRALASNILNTGYEEVSGVAMSGRAVTISLAIFAARDNASDGLKQEPR